MGSKVGVSNQEYNVVGSRPIRHDGVEKVTGQAKYSADIHLPGMLHGKILRSPHAHAVIRSINTEKALNEVYRETEDIRKTIQRTGLSFDVVWDMTGMKDYFDFEETEWKE